MKTPSGREAMALVGLALGFGIWYAAERAGYDPMSWLLVRQPDVERSAPARAALSAWTAGRFGPNAQLVDVVISQDRFAVILNGFGGIEKYRADLRVQLNGETHCRRLDLTWRDPAHRGSIPEWTYSQRGRYVYSCDGRRIGTVLQDRPQR